MDRCTIMLDSGAYRAFTLGDFIDLRTYIQFIKTNREHLAHYINLDIIQGEPGSNQREYRSEVIDKAWFASRS